MVYKGRMVISFIPLHARMTWLARLALFVGPRTILIQMINLEDLFGRFKTSRTKLSSERNFKDHINYSPKRFWFFNNPTIYSFLVGLVIVFNTIISSGKWQGIVMVVLCTLLQNIK